MAKGKGGTWLFVAVLVGSLAVAGNEQGGSSSPGTSTSGLSSGVQGFGGGDGGGGDQCDGTTRYDSPQGRYTIPTDAAADPVTARDCMLGVDEGSGAPVATLQTALRDCYFQPVDVDGAYGAVTRDAVRAVQANVGVTVDGKYGPETAGAMAWPTSPDSGPDVCVAHPA